MPIAAWQYDLTAPMPVWVARRWHQLGGRARLSCLTGGQIQVARPGDWIVCLHGAVMVALTAVEFALNFEALPAETMETANSR